MGLNANVHVVSIELGDTPWTQPFLLFILLGSIYNKMAASKESHLKPIDMHSTPPQFIGTNVQ